MKRAALTGCALLLTLIPSMLLMPQVARAAVSVTIGMQLEPPILDPTASPAAAISEALYGNLFEGLVQFAVDGSVLPQLAGSWDVSAGGLGESAKITPGRSPRRRGGR